MKTATLKRENWFRQTARFRRNRSVDESDRPSSGAVGTTAPSRAKSSMEPEALRRSIRTVAWAFRGYDVQNMGRSRELLLHDLYGPIVRETLEHVGEIASEAVGRPIDLVHRVECEHPTRLEEFPEDVALIVAMEWAQLRILEDVFHIPIRNARLSIGYSIGELTALILGGSYTMEQLLPVPLSLATDCAELAQDTTMGVLFTRGAALVPADVERMCRAVSIEGNGLVGPSAYLAPNTALLLGQGDTLSRVEQVMRDYLPRKTSLRRNGNRWPPLHSPLMWRKNIPNRTAMMLYQRGGGERPPVPPIYSCVSGKANYDEHNAREMLVRWTDQPQRLWDAIDGTLAAGVHTVVHVGPAPNLIPSTFERLSNNIQKQLGHPMLRKLGYDVAHTIQRHAWLAHLLPSRASLLRVPWLNHIVLEDWLLARPVATLCGSEPQTRERRLMS